MGMMDDKNPIALLTAIISIAMALLGVVIWIVKRQFDAQEKQSERLERVAIALERILSHLKIGT